MSSPSRSPSWRGGPPGKSGCPETCRKPSLQWENSRRVRAREGRRCRPASWSRCSHGSTARLARSSFSAPARNTTGCSAPGHCLSDSPGSPEPVDGSISHYETGACLWAPPTTWGQETRVDVAGVDALGPPRRLQHRVNPEEVVRAGAPGHRLVRAQSSNITDEATWDLVRSHAPVQAERRHPIALRDRRVPLGATHHMGSRNTGRRCRRRRPRPASSAPASRQPRGSCQSRRSGPPPRTCPIQQYHRRGDVGPRPQSCARAGGTASPHSTPRSASGTAGRACSRCWMCC